jgi:hypothetical protein
MNYFEEELAQILAPEIERGNLELDPDLRKYIFGILQNFPICASRIAWQHVPGAIIEVASSRASELSDFRDFFDRIIRENSIGGKVIYVGDSLTDSAYIAHSNFFIRYYSDFLSIPHHHYFVPADFSWCVNFSFEGRMAFGRATSTAYNEQIELQLSGRRRRKIRSGVPDRT